MVVTYFAWQELALQFCLRWSLCLFRPVYPFEEGNEDEEVVGDDEEAELDLRKMDQEDEPDAADDSDGEGGGPFLDLAKPTQKHVK